MAAVAAIAALALVAAFAWALRESGDDRVSPHWRDDHFREDHDDR